MNPHQEALQSTYDFLLYEIGRLIRPRPNWHELDTHSCWQWTGDFSPEYQAQKKRFDFRGSKVNDYKKRGLPIIRLGATRSISVHRFLYLIYRQPTQPLSVLRKVNCAEYGCVNPWHWEGYEKEQVKTGPKPWPVNSALNHLKEFLAGDMADDPESVRLREGARANIEIEYEVKLKKTHAVIPHADWHVMKSETAQGITETAARPELHGFGMHHWMKEGEVGRQWYDTLLDYNIKTRGLRGNAELSEVLIARLKWYDMMTPILHDPADYRIGFYSIEDATELLEEYSRETPSATASGLFGYEQGKVHARLILLGIGGARKALVSSIDWTN